MNEVTLRCSNCDCALAWKIPGKDYSICSSAYFEGFSLCHDCLVEHCLNTNCFGCNIGKYPECAFFPTKNYYMEEYNQKNKMKSCETENIIP